jgi:hypothetical protein
MLCKKICAALGFAILAVQVVYASNTNNAVSFWVPGNANPWLAGMSYGSIAGDKYDVAPDQSPVLVTGVPVTSGTIFIFSVVGEIAQDSTSQLCATGADGGIKYIVSRTPGPENGIANIKAPIDALIGVFLDDSDPSNFPPPVALDFSTVASRDFTSLSPELRQPFFIGDGKDSAGHVQEFVSPTGATRLFLGTMDSWRWSDNIGSFTVTVTALPKSP